MFHTDMMSANVFTLSKQVLQLEAELSQALPACHSFFSNSLPLPTLRCSLHQLLKRCMGLMESESAAFHAACPQSVHA